MHLSVCDSVYYLVAFSFLTTGLAGRINTDNYGVANKYILYKCYDQNGAMETLLLQIFSGLNNAIESINSMGSTPTPVYNAFFGGVDPAVVKGVFERILAGAKISVNGQPRNPSIACVNKQDPSWNFHVAECNRIPNTQAFVNLEGPNYIFLCPHFPSLPTAPVEKDCAKLNQARSRLSYSRIGGGTQYTVLLHELVHMYLGQSSLAVEVYDVNPAMSLPPSQAAINPENYAFFVGSM
ncbi:hypothetical protein MMC32_008129 [Xylographa parallela]|nr:hypothetical protein [Xylographa parallela]